ncbi:MAG: phosphoglycerate dehydrogenase [Chloroflexi bacterium]|nr:phosphoglycerate dehydrogenase [Chloroflexota bacterium]
MKRVLVTEPLAPEGIALLQTACEVDIRLNPSPKALRDMISAYDALIVRSSTPVTAEVLERAERLMVIARAGTGVDNIDLEAATRRGILVVNAPTSNTVAVAEHTLALMLALARHIPKADALMHAGHWEKKSLMGTELRDKVLGLVGLGRVGTAVASRARGFEMRVIAHDPFVSPEWAQRLNVELVSLERLLAEADYVSLHVPSTERTRGMIGARELAQMKRTAYLINCARGDLIVEADLIQALRQGLIAGAALDVFPGEPRLNPDLLTFPNVVLTPHLGASTQEAQSGAALQVAQQVLDVLSGRQPRHPVNITALSAEEMAFLRPYLDLGTQMGRFYAQYAENNLTRLEIIYAGDVEEHNTQLITAAVLMGILGESGEEAVNLVNARLVAAERGLVIREARTSEAQGFSGLITLIAHTTSREHLLSGTVMRGQPHLVRIGDYWLDFVLRGHLLVSEHIEQPGIIGQMGLLLGSAGINISFVQVGRQERGGPGLMVTGLDDPLSAEVMARIMAMPSIRRAAYVRL